MDVRSGREPARHTMLPVASAERFLTGVMLAERSVGRVWVAGATVETAPAGTVSDRMDLSRLRNRSVRAELKTRIRSAVEAAESGENVAEATAVAMKRSDRAGDRRVLHPNAAARRKSRLQKRLNGLSS